VTFRVEPARDRTPVVMAVWKRTDRLARTLELLGEQSAPAALYVWNNNPRRAEEVDRALRDSPVPAQSFHCSRNIGCFGRFYVARELAPSHEAVLFVDDDQDFGPTMVADQLASFEPRSLAGWWAFTYRRGARSYADRDRVAKPFERADYVGVGGMVADTSVFVDPDLFRCPRRYWFVDDIWLSYFAGHRRRWMLRRSRAEFSFAPDDLNIDVTLAATKRRMFRYLKRRGWAVGR